MGWHLRFSKGRHLRVMALKESRQQLENVLHIHPEWRLIIAEKNDHLEADYVRKDKFYEKE